MSSAARPIGGKILVVDDELCNVEILADVLEPDFEVVFATSGAGALDIVERVDLDLVLLDVMMPGLDGYGVISRLKSDAATADIPVIFITGLTDSEAETRGLELGAVDFVTKPFTAAVVRARVRNHVELKRARDQIMLLAMTDGLTGLANRRRFDAVLEAEVKRHARSKSALSLILLDLDYFKAFNDRYGHVAGDECLRLVSGVLGTTIRRTTDLAARYGGEEFACILPDTDLAGATAIAEHIGAGIERLAIPHVGSHVAKHVTVSLGVLGASCTRETTPRDVLSAVDGNLYRAKSEGRNRIAASQMELVAKAEN